MAEACFPNKIYSYSFDACQDIAHESRTKTYKFHANLEAKPSPLKTQMLKEN